MGFHHATSFAGNPKSNIEFHKTALGLRLVKCTVNFDEPAAYHLYFSTGTGAPGTVLTSFPGYSVRPSARTNLVVCLSGDVPAAFHHHEPPRFGEEILSLRDPDGLLLEWKPGEGPLHIHAVTLTVAEPEPTIAFFTRVLGFSRASNDANRTRLASADRKILIDILKDPAAGRSRFGAGITHHIAFHVADEAQQLAWRDLLMQAQVRVSLVKDRYYFHSIYFREPSGILLEIATGGPGFLIDEDEAHLGESLCLPPWFEPIREKIQARLKERDVV